MKRRVRQRGVRIVGAIVTCTVAVTFASQRAEAQAGPSLQNPRAIVTKTDAYVVGSPLPLAGAHAVAYPDPRGRYVLYVRDQEASQSASRNVEPKSGRASLSLYDSHTGRIRELWTTNPPLGGTGAGAVTRVEWLSGADAALIVTREDSGAGAIPERKTEYTLFCVHPDKGLRAFQTLLSGDGRLIFWRSPSAPYAVVTEIIDKGAPDETGSLAPKRIFDDHGQIGPVLHLDTDFLGLEWSEDGKTLFASVQVSEPDDTAGAVGTTRRHKRSVSVDATTGEVHVVTTLPRNRRVSPSLVRQAETKPPALPLRIVADVVMTTAPGLPVSEHTKAGVRLTPLYLQYAESDQTGATPSASAPEPPLNSTVFLADNGESAVVLADLSAVIYTAHDALFAVPIVHESRSAFDNSRGVDRQAETQAKLRTIASAISEYVGDSDGHHYPPAIGIAGALKNYLSDTALLGSDFTYLLNGDPYPGDAAAANVVVAYLAGPGGRAVLTGDGMVNWEDLP